MPLPTAMPNCSGVSRTFVWSVVARSDGDAAIFRKGKRLPRRPDYHIIRVRLFTFPSRGSPLRSDCRPHSGRNDVIKPNDALPFWETVEKSPAEETETVVHVCGGTRASRPTDGLAALQPSPSGARRGGTKCRKNSPQVTVFSQSGEVTVLRTGRWIAGAKAKARRMRGRVITEET